MARSLGAKVYPGSGAEIGWGTLELSEDGKNSALVHLASEHTSVLHWHGDTFDLPVGSTHLAATTKYQNQAFSWGRNGLALQFHPEVTARGLERWFIGHASEIGASPSLGVRQLRQDTANYAKGLEVQAHQLWQTWLEQVNL